MVAHLNYTDTQLSANYSTYLFRQRLCSRLTALWHYMNFVLLLLL